MLLFVGRLSPNKCHERLVEALWVYRRLYDPDARLHLVGPTVTPEYAEAVFAFADELGLADAVRHAEGLTGAELAAWYGDADVFVCLSEHEGFCIPLLEAMRADTPIVALDAGAVGETLADAGLLLEEARPATVAAAVHRIRQDDGLSLIHICPDVVDDDLRALGGQQEGLLTSDPPACAGDDGDLAVEHSHGVLLSWS